MCQIADTLMVSRAGVVPTFPELSHEGFGHHEGVDDQGKRRIDVAHGEAEHLGFGVEAHLHRHPRFAPALPCGRGALRDPVAAGQGDDELATPSQVELHSLG